MSLTTLFGEHPDVRVVEFLATHPDFDYNISEIARNSGISRPSAYKVVDRLERRDILVRTRRVGTSSYFGLNARSPLVAPLLDLEVRLAEVPSARVRRAATPKAVRR